MIEHLLQQNFITATDGYKCCHWQQIPSEVDYTYTVMVPRKLAPYMRYSDKIVAAGQSMIASYLASVRITEEMIDEAEIEINQQGYTFNRVSWEYIARELNGKLPLLVMGVEEGRLVDPQTPIMGWVNTKPGFSWLCGHVETVIQSIGWKMSTVASICKEARVMLKYLADDTGTEASVDYMLHNFGDRGADSPEAAVIAGIAHAMIFDGSDCTSANRYIKKLYKTPKSYTSSIIASEHFTMTSHSNCKDKDDFPAAVMMVEQLEQAVLRSEQGIGIPFVSGVIDTYDDERFVKEYLGDILKDRIINSGGRFVARPDSGDPLKKPGQIGKLLAESFGTTTNHRGYKVLNPAVGVIQGDGLTIDTIEGVVLGWIDAGFSLDNFALGMGSGVTHDGRRDDFSFSVKAIANKSLHGWISLVKDPKTDSGKKSLTGLARCSENENGELELINNLKRFGGELDMWIDQPGWKVWFKDGHRMNNQTFDEVRRRARA